MMPFLVGQTFEECQLPENLRPYWPMIEACLYPEMNRAWHHLWPSKQRPSELGKVNYLTVHESFVEEGTSQRRPGLHVDMPGVVKVKNKDPVVPGTTFSEHPVKNLNSGGDKLFKGDGSSSPYLDHHWGVGCAHLIPLDSEERFELVGGIYLASSMANTCRVWNVSVKPEAIGRLV